jgi:hypothetical protein
MRRVLIHQLQDLLMLGRLLTESSCGQQGRRQDNR